MQGRHLAALFDSHVLLDLWPTVIAGAALEHAVAWAQTCRHLRDLVHQHHPVLRHVPDSWRRFVLEPPQPGMWWPRREVCAFVWTLVACGFHEWPGAATFMTLEWVIVEARPPVLTRLEWTNAAGLYGCGLSFSLSYDLPLNLPSTAPRWSVIWEDTALGKLAHPLDAPAEVLAKPCRWMTETAAALAVPRSEPLALGYCLNCQDFPTQSPLCSLLCRVQYYRREAGLDQ